MSRMITRILIASALLIPVPALSQAERSEIEAANGRIVVQYSDDFANRHEYSVDLGKPRADNITIGSAILLVVRKGDEFAGPAIQGQVYYDGDWRYYHSAVFEGGDSATYVRAGSDVGSCSRYGGCSKVEDFTILFTPEEIEKHSASGVLRIQVRAKDSNVFFIDVPQEAIEALLQVSNKPK